MTQFRQEWRDLGMVACCLLFLQLFSINLNTYLADLTNPIFIKVAFFSAFVTSCLYDCREKSRYALAMALCNATIFLGAALLAEGVRAVFVEALNETKIIMTDPRAVEALGYEYIEVLQNKVIGYGACFFFALAIVRLVARSNAFKLIEKTFIAPKYRRTKCGMCGSLV